MGPVQHPAQLCKRAPAVLLDPGCWQEDPDGEYGTNKGVNL